MSEEDESQEKSNLLEEIKYQRCRQVKSCNNTEDFVMVSSVTLWTDLFIRYFVNCEDASHDDLLMFVRKKTVHGSRYFTRFQTQIEVFRKDSKKLPVGNVDIDWEETLYLNFINQCFEYHLTTAIVSRTVSRSGADQMQILKKFSQRVFASPSYRSMHGKAESEDISYPSIYFSIDNYDQVQAELFLRAGDLVCVELMAVYKPSSQRYLLFSGSLDYDSLSLCSDVKMRMPTMFGLRAFGSSKDKTTFVKVKSPTLEGEAEVAITRAPGSASPTPTGPASPAPIGSASSAPTGSASSAPIGSASSAPTESASYSPGTDDWTKFEVTEITRRVSSRRSSSLLSCFNPLQDFEYSARVTGSLDRVNIQWTDSKADKTRSLGEGLDSLSKGMKEIEAIDLRKEMSQDDRSKKILSRKGFTQSFHFWKENKRIKSIPLLVGVTFITLKYFEIMRIFMDKNEEPILTF